MKGFLKTMSLLVGSMIIMILAIASNSELLDSCDAFIPDPYRYGDLYMLSNMPGYKISTKSNLTRPVADKNKKIALTVIGDSYTDKFDSSFFNAGSYRFIHWDYIPDTIPLLDSTKTNIVIIESTERYTRWRFMGKSLLHTGKKKLKDEDRFPKILNVEDNLQYMLTYFDWEFPFKEMKTYIYLYCFNKFSPLVEKPDHSGRLYLNETVDSLSNASSFNNVANEEIKGLVENLNSLSGELASIGFDKVYYSIVPNAASIYKKSKLPYNHLIERIQNHPSAKFNYIDVYRSFKEEKSSVFYCNDSHWNDRGKKIWLDKVNDLLKQQ